MQGNGGGGAGSRFAGRMGRPFSKRLFSRTAVRVKENLGIIFASDRTKVKKVRNKDLELFDKYYEGTQYLGMPEWDEAGTKDGEFVPVRKRQPRIQYNLAKVIVDRVAAKLVGEDVFPVFKVEDDPDTETYIKLLIKAAKLQSRLIETIKLMGLSGSALMRFYLSNGSIKIETYHAKNCYPVFQDNGDLQAVKIQYVYSDEDDLDGTGKPKEKWYRLDLGQTADILYDNPVYIATAEPMFTPVSTVEHNLGFVQAEWFRTCEDKHSPDGYSFISDLLDFIDELNYSLSQASQAVAYGQEPQLTISGLDAEELDNIIKSSQKAWNLGRDGKAEFLEVTLEGVKQGQELRDKIRLAVQDVSRVVMLDPEKMATHAQSGKAMEALHGPFVELINELRPQIEDRLISLLTKIAMIVLQSAQAGLPTDIVIPDGYQPQSLNITIAWPPIFAMTMDDLLKKAQLGIAVAGASLITRETITRWLAKDFGVENIDEEIQKLASQPILSPFGSQGFGGLGGGGFGVPQ